MKSCSLFKFNITLFSLEGKAVTKSVLLVKVSAKNNGKAPVQ